MENIIGAKHDYMDGYLDYWTETDIAMIEVKGYALGATGWDHLGAVRCHCGEIMLNPEETCYGPDDLGDCPEGSIVDCFLVRPEAEELWKSPQSAKTRRWFHATLDPHWLVNAQRDGFLVHIGAEESAHALGGGKYQHTPGGYWLYEVAFVEDASFAGYLCPDLSALWERKPEILRERIDHNDFIGYVNAYEAPGMVSFYGDARKLVEVSRIWVTANDEVDHLANLESMIQAKMICQSPYGKIHARATLEEFKALAPEKRAA